MNCVLIVILYLLPTQGNSATYNPSEMVGYETSLNLKLLIIMALCEYWVNASRNLHNL